MDLPRLLPLTAGLTPRARVLVGALTVTGAIAVVLVALAVGPRDVLVGVGVISGAALCLLRAGIGPAPRRPWLAFAAAIVLYAVGAAVHEAAFADQVDSYAGVADLLWSGLYVGAYVGIGLLVRSRLRKVHPVGWLDGAIGACAGGALGAALLYEPVADYTGGSLAAVTINLAYPVADVLLLGFLAMLLAIEGWRLSRSRLMILVALLVLLVSDTAYLLLAASGTYTDGMLIDAGWPTVMLLIGVAAWEEQGMRGRARVRPWVAMAAPSVFTLLAVGLVIYGNVRPLGAVAVVLATLALLLGAVRTALSFRAVQELALRRRQAVTDELTGLPNRRALYERLDRASPRTRVTGCRCSCSTSTASRRSTTRSGTTRAICCCAGSARGCATPCATRTCWPGSAATSSASCSRARASTTRSRSRAASGPLSSARSRSKGWR